MSYWYDEALVLSRIDYSESSIILTVFTRNHGIRKGMVRGGKNKKIHYMYEAGNYIKIEWRGRSEDSLGSFKCELLSSSYVLFTTDKIKFAGILSVLNLIEFCLLESDQESKLFDETHKLLNIIINQPVWFKYYIFWEILLLERTGFGLQLLKCGISGKNNKLEYVSPKSGNAISNDYAGEWKDRLLVLPRFIIYDDVATIDDIINAFKITSKFLNKFAYSVGKKLPFTREHFIDKIKNQMQQENEY